MSELKICRICLRTEAKVYNYEQFHLKSYYEEVLSLKVNEVDELPRYFCVECSMLLHKYHKFKEKCHSGKNILKELLAKGPAGINEISKLSTKMTSPESENESPFLETNLTITEPPVLSNEFINTNPVEIDSFFINSLDVVLEESLIENAQLSNICIETPNTLQFQQQTIETETDLLKNTNHVLNVRDLANDEQNICNLPNRDQTLLESELGYKEIESTLTENMEDSESSMLYGDLPSISQVFEESNIDYIESLSNNNNIDDDLNNDLCVSSQDPIIEYIQTESDVTKTSGDIEITEKQTANEDASLVQEPCQETGEGLVTADTTETGVSNIQIGETSVEEMLVNESVPMFNCAPNIFMEEDVDQDTYCLNTKDSYTKVKITSKNQVAPNIHSVVPTTSQEYFETTPDPQIDDNDPGNSLNQLETEPGEIKTVEITRVPTCIKRPKPPRIRRKYPFRKEVKPSPCHKKCGNYCSDRLTDVDRRVIHENYWKMEKIEQQKYLIDCIRARKIKRRQGSTLAKTITYDYYINHEGQDVKVCQQFLMKTLDISQMRFRYAVSKYNVNDYDVDDDSDSND